MTSRQDVTDEEWTGSVAPCLPRRRRQGGRVPGLWGERVSAGEQRMLDPVRAVLGMA
jgi:hypothetical protein